MWTVYMFPYLHINYIYIYICSQIFQFDIFYNRPPKFFRLLLQYFTHQSVNMITSQGICRGMKADLFLFCNCLHFQIWQFCFNIWINCLHARSQISPPLVKETSLICEETHFTNLANNEHLHSKAKELSHTWKSDVPAFLFPRSYGHVHKLSYHLFDCLVRDLKYGPWPTTLYWKGSTHLKF
jgi:hypothetical protein